MRLVSFTIENFRSITKAYKIRIGQTAILIGPNNEGKSNILRALVAAMNVLTRTVSSQYRRRMEGWYNWERDFPVDLQPQKPNGESKVTLEFELTVDEVAAFQREIGSALNGTLPIRVIFSAKAHPTVKVAKPGRGGRALTLRSVKVAEFLAARLSFEHIPAVRTADSAQRLVDEMVQRELSHVEEDARYQKALQSIEAVQRPLLDALAESIQVTLTKFLPRVNSVLLRVSQEGRYAALRQDCEIVVDDGTPTLLRYKGDGVQSLAALGIMRHVSDRREKNINLVIAVEEPESHLHPRAIHELRDVLKELSEKHQVIISTHCPLFVDRTSVRRNIIVSANKARPAKNVQEIRQTLGVRAADNLRNAELVLMVEGEEDKSALQPILSHRSERLKNAFNNGTIAIDSLAGGTNLAYKLGQLRDSLCLYRCFLDDDKCGRDAFTKARAEGLVDAAEVTFTVCNRMDEAEIEDLYELSIYQPLVKNLFSVDIGLPRYKSNKKWSVRMKECFKGHGKQWNDQVERELKWRVSEVISADPTHAINPHRKDPVDALVRNLEEALDIVSRKN